MKTGRIGTKLCTKCGRVKGHDNGRLSQCRACLNLYEAIRRTNQPELFMLYRAKSRATKMGLAFNLSRSDIVIPPRCPALKIPLYRCSSNRGKREASPSLDRLIPELGYIKGNVRVISNKANVMKNNASVEELRQVADWLEEETRTTQFLTNPSIQKAIARAAARRAWRKR